MPFRRLLTAVLVPVALLLAACASAAEAGPRVFFISPADGAEVSSPAHVTLGAENFTIEPAGEVKAGVGHLHIMLDTACVTAGEIIPKDATHLHYGQGQLEADLELAPGPHTLCLQAADGAHTALAGDGLTHLIAVTVK
ncbi:MAG: DUF4399 domain-containing protein [Anaerolineales bacterium]|nr:DUF4399 domain-containing protein [Anaerolineales bacterium]